MKKIIAAALTAANLAGVLAAPLHDPIPEPEEIPGLASSPKVPSQPQFKDPPPIFPETDLFGMPNRLPTGRWVGELTWSDPDRRVGTGASREGAVMVHCNGEAHIWNRDATGQLSRGRAKGRIASFSGSHVLYELSDYGTASGWVEVALWTFIELDENRMDVRLSRTVSNPEVETDGALRSIGNTAWGRLHKVSDSCKPE